MKNNHVVEYVIRQLLEVQNGKLWMGDTFEKKINSITEQEAFLRPLPTLHSVAELIAHLTAWRKDVILKIKNGRGLLTGDNEKNWPDNGELKKIGWNNLIRDYQNSLSAIINLLQDKEDYFLDEQYYDQDFKGRFDYSFAIKLVVNRNPFLISQQDFRFPLAATGPGYESWFFISHQGIQKLRKNQRRFHYSVTLLKSKSWKSKLKSMSGEIPFIEIDIPLPFSSN